MPFYIQKVGGQHHCDITMFWSLFSAVTQDGEIMTVFPAAWLLGWDCTDSSWALLSYLWGELHRLPLPSFKPPTLWPCRYCCWCVLVSSVVSCWNFPACSDVLFHFNPLSLESLHVYIVSFAFEQHEITTLLWAFANVRSESVIIL